MKLDVKEDEEMEAVDVLVGFQGDFDLQIEAVQLAIPVPVRFVALQ